MSSSEDEPSSVQQNGDSQPNPRPRRRGAKLREALRACDACRQRKARCDALPSSGGPCSSCVKLKLECAFTSDTKKRTQPSKAYIDDLEQRCRDIELLLNRVAPDVDINSELGPSFTKDTWQEVKGTGVKAKSSRPTLGSRKAVRKRESDDPLDPVTNPVQPLDNAQENIKIEQCTPTSKEIMPKKADEPEELVQKTVKELRIGEENQQFPQFFHGKSSAASLVDMVLHLKNGTAEIPPSGEKFTFKARSQFRRPQFWETLPIANESSPSEILEFPPDNLCDELIELCFNHAMTIYPIVHRPSFERDRADGRHKVDMNFAKLLLLVCAVGSRFTDDPRVLLKNSDGENALQSAGWKYFTQTILNCAPMLMPMKLLDLQNGAMTCLYLMGSSAIHAPWLMACAILRCAQDIGAHREKVYGSDPAHAFQNQMWKRAFWSLVTMDRIVSSGLGRSVAIYDEDIDTELPLEVDDEHFDEERKEWIQPPGKPARMSAFVHLIKLHTIHAYAIRTLYAINKSKAAFVGPNWEADIVAELDSALNSWSDNLPPFLAWDPSISNKCFLWQAALLRLAYDYVQITVHRKYLAVAPGDQQAASLSLPSLAICTNAARSTVNVIDKCDGKILKTSYLTHSFAFNAATVLLVSMWEIRRTRVQADVTRYMDDVRKCIQYLQAVEERWYVAGSLCDILVDLSSMKDGDMSKRTSIQLVPAKKRGQDEPPQDEQRRPSNYKPFDYADQRASLITTNPDNPFPQTTDNGSFSSMDAYLMSHGGLDAELSTGLQWNQSEVLFPVGQLPIFDPSWEKYLIGGTGIMGIAGGLPFESYGGLQTTQSFPTSGLLGQLPDYHGVTLPDYHGGPLPECSAPLLDHSLSHCWQNGHGLLNFNVSANAL